MKLVAMLRVKNAKLTLVECLTKLSQLCDEIVIVDNGSTDGTLGLYKKFPKIVNIAHSKGFHEGRDKILALKMAKARKPDWILWIDADEVFEDLATRPKLDRYMNNPKLNLVRFRMFNFWLSKTHYRVDSIWSRYTAQPQRAMWRNQASAYFRNLKFHNGGIQGVRGKTITSCLRLKHLGYIHSGQIRNKNKIYNRLKNDPMTLKTLPTNNTDLSMHLKEWYDGLWFAYFNWIKWGLIQKYISIKNYIYKNLFK